jgi:hypothetical protein
MRLLNDEELDALRPAETAAFAGPMPTQIVSSDEYRAILGGNIAALYGYRRHAELSGPSDRLAALKTEYEASGGGRSNLRYGYVLVR